jgi:hypothetical protein
VVHPLYIVVVCESEVCRMCVCSRCVTMLKGLLEDGMELIVIGGRRNGGVGNFTVRSDWNNGVHVRWE